MKTTELVSGRLIEDIIRSLNRQEIIILMDALSFAQSFPTRYKLSISHQKAQQFSQLAHTTSNVLWNIYVGKSSSDLPLHSASLLNFLTSLVGCSYSLGIVCYQDNLVSWDTTLPELKKIMLTKAPKLSAKECGLERVYQKLNPDRVTICVCEIIGVILGIDTRRWLWLNKRKLS